MYIDPQDPGPTPPPCPPTRFERALSAVVHWWRLAFEPSGGGIITMQPRRYHVVYYEGGRSIDMAYSTACNYADTFGGKVVKS